MTFAHAAAKSWTNLSRASSLGPEGNLTTQYCPARHSHFNDVSILIQMTFGILISATSDS